MAINPDKLNEFLGKAIVDFGATFHAALIRIGDLQVGIGTIEVRRAGS